MSAHLNSVLRDPNEAADLIADLTAALQAVVDQVNDYERVNHLSPSPGRTECWDTVAHAKRVLTRAEIFT